MSGLYFFDSGKKTDDPVRPFKDQIYINMPRQAALYLLANVAKDMAENPDQERVEIGLAGELRE